MCCAQGGVDAYCYECLFASTSVFGNLCCSKDCNKCVGWYQRACNDFKDRYEVNITKENDGNNL